MAKNKNTSATEKTETKQFEKTFKNYKTEMTPGEQAAFRQGATTANNSIKERLGLKKSRNEQ